MLFTLLNLSIAKEYHVSKEGKPNNDGSEGSPFLTISEAAEVVEPGDVVKIHEGVYREAVIPRKGGEEGRSITFEAVDGDSVVIKGTEIVDSWTEVGNGVWEITLDDSFFNGYNPFKLFAEGEWQEYGGWHTRGDVYINNKVLDEQEEEDEVASTEGSWFINDSGDKTHILANFGDLNPNNEMTEVAVRNVNFFTESSGVNYITLRGIHFTQAALDWQAPNAYMDHDTVQIGAVGTSMGKGWVIENCEVSYAKTACIMLGEDVGLREGGGHEDIDAFGSHLVQNNYVHFCGEYGIAGQKGIARSLIKHNLVEDINWRNEFGGHEPAAIKIWNAADVTIEDNLVRRTFGDVSGFGIWIDYGNQGTRITRNIVYDTRREGLYLEANFGPTLVDNNIVDGRTRFGEAVLSYSAGDILVHNLWYGGGFKYSDQNGRQSTYVQPHTMIITYGDPVYNNNNHTYNNIFAGEFTNNGIVGDEESESHISHNLYMKGTKVHADDANAKASDHEMDFEIETTRFGVSISFSMDNSFEGFETPVVDTALIGIIPLANQSIEDKDGNPIVVNTDINNNDRTSANPLVGPLASLKEGTNTVSWTLHGDPGSVSSSSSDESSSSENNSSFDVTLSSEEFSSSSEEETNSSDEDGSSSSEDDLTPIANQVVLQTQVRIILPGQIFQTDIQSSVQIFSLNGVKIYEGQFGDYRASAGFNNSALLVKWVNH